MTIVSPTGMEIPPSGEPANPTAVVSETITGTATGNEVHAETTIGSVPETGPYYLILAGISSNATASAGQLDATLRGNGGATVITMASLSLTVAETQISSGIIVLTSLPVTLEWTISGFGVGSTDYKLVASAVKLF